MKMMKNIVWIVFAVYAMLLGACSNNYVEEINSSDIDEHPSEARTIPMRLEGGIEYFDAKTRSASSNWEDGAHLYIQYHTPDKSMKGIATYVKSKGEWEIQNDEVLKEGQANSCEVYYFETPESTSDTLIVFTAQSSVFVDNQASSIYEEGVVKVYAHLKPITGRIRFRGTQGQQISVSGLKSYTRYDIANNSLSEKAMDLPLTINNDSHTPYVYSRFNEASSCQLDLDNGTDNIIFRKTFERDVLAPGLSGYLDVPTAGNHAGWLTIEYAPDTLGLCPNANHPHMIDMGLGLKWACCNVGAKSPIDIGSYYAWGETATKLEYNWTTYKWCNGSKTTLTKYCNSASNGTVDNKYLVEREDDAAYVNWGKTWRTPTTGEFKSLSTSYYNYSIVSINNVKGLKVTALNGNSIFFPAAGHRRGSEYIHLNTHGRYWTSSSSNEYAWYFHYHNTSNNPSVVKPYLEVVTKDDNGGTIYRCYGMSIRPVVSEEN